MGDVHGKGAVTRTRQPLPAKLFLIVRPWPRYIAHGIAFSQVIDNFTCFYPPSRTVHHVMKLTLSFQALQGTTLPNYLPGRAEA
jgi:hypothetical protein